VKVHLNIEHYVCVELVVGSIVLALAPRSGVLGTSIAIEKNK